MRKQMEGDQAQRRRKAKTAREKGRSPSADAATTGASKQRDHESRSKSSARTLGHIRRGKQPVLRQVTPQPNPGSGRRTRENTPKKAAPKSARPSARKRGRSSGR
jgi:hypothetical protein